MTMFEIVAAELHFTLYTHTLLTYTDDINTQSELYTIHGTWFWFINQQDSLTNMFADVGCCDLCKQQKTGG